MVRDPGGSEQPPAADALQRPLRSRFQARLRRSVLPPLRRRRENAVLSRALLSLRSATGEQGARDRCPKGARLSTALCVSENGEFIWLHLIGGKWRTSFLLPDTQSMWGWT